MMGLLVKTVAASGDRTYANFIRFKTILSILLGLWLVAAIAVVGFWADLHVIVRLIAIGYCCLVIPTFDTLEQFFMRFETYKREGI